MVSILSDQHESVIHACRCPDPAVLHQLIRCCVIPHLGWLMQEVTQERTGLSWFRPQGRTSSKGVCERTILSCTRILVVGGTSEAREREGSSQASARGEVD